jgi:aspartyl-tRNA(Asn)/glutamyl-tRNA(Gln) amidotransferase subunit A
MARADIENLSIEELAHLLESRQVSSVELIERMLTKIYKHDGTIRSFVRVADNARAKAEEVDKEIKRGMYKGHLHGIPIAIKDNYLTADVPTRAGTTAPDISFPLIDAAAVTRLRQSGAVLIGKTNMHEFAWGNVTPPTRNPWDIARVPGGSSGGSGAAVASSFCSAALGSDTGGSIRIPASLCGTVGLKATYGLISKRGVITHSWSLDHAGPLTKTVGDAALLLNALAGYDPTDPSSKKVSVPDYTKCERPLSDLRIGVCRNHFMDRNSDEVQRAIELSIEELCSVSRGPVQISLPNLQYGLGAIFAIELASSSTYHSPSLKIGRQKSFAPDVRTLIEIGNFITATDYLKAEQFRRQLMNDLRRSFDQVDVIVAPTTPITAWKSEETTLEVAGAEESVLAASWRLTYPFNLAGLPAISLPCGFDSRGLPIGLQIAGPPFSEQTLLSLARAYEQRHDWKDRLPVM